MRIERSSPSSTADARLIRQTKLDRVRCARSQVRGRNERRPWFQSCSGLTASLSRDHIVMKTVFHITGSLRIAVERLVFVSFSVNSSVGWRSHTEPAVAVVVVVQLNDARAVGGWSPSRTRAACVESPGPRIAKPERRQERQLSRIWPLIDDVNADQQILRREPWHIPRQTSK